jgi:2-keto-4-pentenoate hydratase/2-oxohepta-3-ene-1,7-dioic acid hydratase in catechol pathway
MSYVAGYTCFNDGSVRDWQKHSSQFTPGKNFFQTAGCGPWMVCRSEIPDVSALELETRVNGVLVQQISMQQMIFDTSWLIEYISTFTPLSAGDMIVTGTPSGFGSTLKPPKFLSDGDKVVVSVTGIGSLVNTVSQDFDPRKLSFS